MHECMNIVAEPEGKAGAVLIRALEPIEGLAIMRARRPKAQTDRDLTSGPGKLTQALAITRAQNGLDLTRGDVTRGDLIVRSPDIARALEIDVSPRIGITKCADLPLRFTVKGNPFISR
jgi:DNA-3-methyladenine glycosylase